jgi:uncharacterized damage-inducible protein DinB
MAETVEQYIKRIQGHVEGKDPLKVQKSTHRKIEKLISRLNKKQLRRRPAKGKWSIAEILAHLADAELVGGWRLRMILTHNGTPIQAFDQDSWASTFRYADRDPKQSLKMFRVLRTNNLALLESVPRQLWKNHGLHAERGKETVAHLVRMYAGHDLNHLKQIEQIARARRK